MITVKLVEDGSCWASAPTVAKELFRQFGAQSRFNAPNSIFCLGLIELGP
ncbi:hypothetical protein [Polynucleobacter antarcticus]|nr:hypothetical protein [Polynucleobacter antarcticus]